MEAANDRKTPAMSDLLRFYSCGRLAWSEDRAALLAGIQAKCTSTSDCVGRFAHAIHLELVDHFVDTMVGADYNGASLYEAENRAADGPSDFLLALTRRPGTSEGRAAALKYWAASAAASAAAEQAALIDEEKEEHLDEADYAIEGVSDLGFGVVDIAARDRPSISIEASDGPRINGVASGGARFLGCDQSELKALHSNMINLLRTSRKGDVLEHVSLYHGAPPLPNSASSTSAGSSEDKCRRPDRAAVPDASCPRLESGDAFIAHGRGYTKGAEASHGVPAASSPHSSLLLTYWRDVMEREEQFDLVSEFGRPWMHSRRWVFLFG